MQIKEIPIDLSQATDAQHEAIEREAQKFGDSFDEACLRMLLQHADTVAKKPRLNPIARLFSFRSVH